MKKQPSKVIPPEIVFIIAPIVEMPRTGRDTNDKQDGTDPLDMGNQHL